MKELVWKQCHHFFKDTFHCGKSYSLVEASTPYDSLIKVMVIIIIIIIIIMIIIIVIIIIIIPSFSISVCLFT